MEAQVLTVDVAIALYDSVCDQLRHEKCPVASARDPKKNISFYHRILGRHQQSLITSGSNVGAKQMGKCLRNTISPSLQATSFLRG